MLLEHNGSLYNGNIALDLFHEIKSICSEHEQALMAPYVRSCALPIYPIQSATAAILAEDIKYITKYFSPIITRIRLGVSWNGEMTGTHWIKEQGCMVGPIATTNTNSIGAVHESVNVRALTWDGNLNDIDGFNVKFEHVKQAFECAKSGPVAEGTLVAELDINFECKSGMGTASRIVTTSYNLGRDFATKLSNFSAIMVGAGGRI